MIIVAKGLVFIEIFIEGNKTARRGWFRLLLPPTPIKTDKSRLNVRIVLLILRDYPFNFVLFYTGPLSNFSNVAPLFQFDLWRRSR